MILFSYVCEIYNGWLSSRNLKRSNWFSLMPSLGGPATPSQCESLCFLKLGNVNDAAKVFIRPPSFLVLLLGWFPILLSILWRIHQKRKGLGAFQHLVSNLVVGDGQFNLPREDQFIGIDQPFTVEQQVLQPIYGILHHVFELQLLVPPPLHPQAPSRQSSTGLGRSHMARKQHAPGGFSSPSRLAFHGQLRS